MFIELPVSIKTAILVSPHLTGIYIMGHFAHLNISQNRPLIILIWFICGTLGDWACCRQGFGRFPVVCQIGLYIYTQDALVAYIIGISSALVAIGHSNYNLSSCVPESYNYSMLIEHFVEERRNKMVDLKNLIVQIVLK